MTLSISSSSSCEENVRNVSQNRETVKRSTGHSIGTGIKRGLKSTGNFFATHHAKAAATTSTNTFSLINKVTNTIKLKDGVYISIPFLKNLTTTLKTFKKIFKIFSIVVSFFSLARKIAHLADTAFNLKEVSQEKTNKVKGEGNYISVWIPISSSQSYSKEEIRKKIGLDLLIKRIISVIGAFIFFSAVAISFVPTLSKINLIAKIPHLKTFRLVSKILFIIASLIKLTKTVKKLHADYLKTKNWGNLEKIPTYIKIVSSTMSLFGFLGLISMMVKKNKILSAVFLILSIRTTLATISSYSIKEIIKYRKEDERLLRKNPQANT